MQMGFIDVLIERLPSILADPYYWLEVIVLASIMIAVVLLICFRPAFVLSPGESPSRSLHIKSGSHTRWTRGRFYHVTAWAAPVSGWCEALKMLYADPRSKIIFVGTITYKAVQHFFVAYGASDEDFDFFGHQLREGNTGRVASLLAAHRFIGCSCSGPLSVLSEDDQNGTGTYWRVTGITRACEMYGVSLWIRNKNRYGGSASASDTLSIISQLRPSKLGFPGIELKIAATGMIDELGNIHPVGGIAQKTVAAERNRLDILIVHPDNYAEAAKYAKRLRLVQASNIQDAAKSLTPKR